VSKYSKFRVETGSRMT